MDKLLSMSLSLIWLAPIWLAVLGATISLRLSQRRWILHVSVLAMMLLAPFAAIYLQGIIDPTTIQNPGPGDGFVLLLYLPELVLSAVVYLICIFATRRNDSRPSR
jgi:hypothetical protein